MRVLLWCLARWLRRLADFVDRLAKVKTTEDVVSAERLLEELVAEAREDYWRH